MSGAWDMTTPPPPPPPLPSPPAPHLPHPQPMAKSNKIFPELSLGPPRMRQEVGDGNQDRRAPAHPDPPFFPAKPGGSAVGSTPKPVGGAASAAEDVPAPPLMPDASRAPAGTPRRGASLKELPSGGDPACDDTSILSPAPEVQISCRPPPPRPPPTPRPGTRVWNLGTLCLFHNALTNFAIISSTRYPPPCPWFWL